MPELREHVTRGCGTQHTGICWTERFRRWWPDKAPRDEYPSRYDWARLGPDGWQPRPCRWLLDGNTDGQ